MFLLLIPMFFGCQKDVSATQKIKANKKSEAILKINFQSSGCFHLREDSLQILKVDDRFVSVRGNHKRFVSLREIEYLENLVEQLKALPKDGMCTTTEKFVIDRNGKSDTISDANCNFDGFQKLENFKKRNGL